MVTRGGFHVGNGINWKGQIFSKMRNYTMTNRMTVCLYNSVLSCFTVLEYSMTLTFTKRGEQRCETVEAWERSASHLKYLDIITKYISIYILILSSNT